MVEVFRTDVIDAITAAHILEALHCRNVLYVANFDLNDCDRVLRVKCLAGEVDAGQVIRVVNDFGFRADVMEDHAMIY